MSRKSESRILINPIHLYLTCYARMNEWMADITKSFKECFESHLEVLPTEIFQLKSLGWRASKKRWTWECELWGEGYIHGELDFLLGKIEQLDLEKRQNDLVVSNIEMTDTTDPNELLQFILNETSMVEVISDGDLISTTIRKRCAQKMIVIGKLKDKTTKLVILAQNVYSKQTLWRKILRHINMASSRLRKILHPRRNTSLCGLVTIKVRFLRRYSSRATIAARLQS